MNFSHCFHLKLIEHVLFVADMNESFDDVLWTLLERDYQLSMDDDIQKELIDSL